MRVLNEIVRSPGGMTRRVVKVDEVEVPDLWHICQLLKEKGQKWQKMSDEIMECWSLCHDLLRNIKGEI